MDPRWKQSFTCVIAGPTGSGKTVWVTRFLNYVSEMMTPPPQEVVWCYGEWQAGYSQLKGVTFVEGLPKVEEWDTTKRRLVILDDLMSEADDRVTNCLPREVTTETLVSCLLCKICLVKTKSSVPLVSTATILLSSRIQETHLAKQIYPGKVKYVQESYKDATSIPHGYLLIDLRQDTPDHLRLRTSIFPSEHLQK